MLVLMPTKQRRFAVFGTLSYADRLRRLNLPSLELRRLHPDLIYCYNIVYGLTDLPSSDYFQMAPLLNTRGHKFQLYKKRYSVFCHRTQQVLQRARRKYME